MSGKIVVNIKKKNAEEIFNFVNSHLTMMEASNDSNVFVDNDYRLSKRVNLPEPKEKAISEYLVKFLPHSYVSEVAEEDFPCTICYEDIVAGEVIRRLRCGHSFHGECVDKWMDLNRDNLSCPVCRKSGYKDE